MHPLPSIRSAKDKRLYHTIFSIQESGDWTLANKLIAELDNDILLGHVLYQKYMHPRLYRSKFLELKKWLQKYADLPGNVSIRKLALKRRPSKSTRVPALKSPVPKSIRVSHPETNSNNKNLIGQARILYRKVLSLVQKGSVTVSLDLVNDKKNRQILKNHGYSLSLSAISRGYYRYHKWNKSISIARQSDSLILSDSRSLESYWWSGLAAWRNNNYSLASEFFIKFAAPTFQDDYNKSKGYYWAALSFLMSGYPSLSAKYLKSSCTQPLSFYGYLACQALSIENHPRIIHSMPKINKDSWSLTNNIPAVRRAIALHEVGKEDLAIKELKLFASPHVKTEIVKSISLIAELAHLPYISYLSGQSLYRTLQQAYIPVLFPQPNWTPTNGYQIDRALMYAIIRQESHFNPLATSRRKARGLMQIIPSTATFIGGSKYKKKVLSLYQPEISMHLGQSYLQWLLNVPKIEGSLLNTLVAYNGGPGNLALWQKKIAETLHPLLYIESLPPRETRTYVKKVLRNMWIYRNAMNLKTPSVVSLLNGIWPVYDPKDSSFESVSASQTTKNS